MHRGVRVQGEAVLHGESASAVVKGQHLGQSQALLNGALLQYLVLVFGPGGLQLRLVLLRLPQRSGQNACDVFVTGRGHRHHRPVLLPHGLRHEEVEVRRELKG